MSGKYFLDLMRFKKMNKIGSGGFSEVFQIMERGSGKKYAAKISLKEVDLNSHAEMLYISREVNILSKLVHPSILRFIGFCPHNFKKEPKPVLVTEYLTNGSLGQILELERAGRSPAGWDQTKKLVVIYGIAVGMAYLHSHNILHRDLKPDNILLDDYLFPKIADFGLSKIYHTDSSIISMESSTNIKGTPAYIAPEIWDDPEYTKAADVYSFAYIMYEIMTGEVPLKNINMVQIIPKICVEGFRPQFKYPIPDSYRKLIEGCWNGIPTKRPSFQYIADLLENDSSFITEGVEEIDFHGYVDFVKRSIIKYKSEKAIIKFSDYITSLSKTFTKVDIKNSIKEIPIKPHIKKEPISLYPQNDLIKLDSSCQQLVHEAETDTEKQFLVGKSIFEGTLGFPKNLALGIQYLKLSIKKGSIESAIYYCRILIEGKQVPANLEKAEEYLKMFFDSEDHRIYLLYAKSKKGQGNFEEALKYFKDSASSGNAEAMYEYGMMFLKGEGITANYERGTRYIEMAKNNGHVPEIDDDNSDTKPKHKSRSPEKKKTRKLSHNNFNVINPSYFDKLDATCQKNILQAEAGDPRSLIFVARSFIVGSNNFPLNEKLGLKYLEYVTDLNIVEAMPIYNCVFHDGHLVPKNEEKAIYILNKAASMSKSSEMKLRFVDILLSHHSYNIHSTDNPNINYPLAKERSKEAADMGNTKAMILYASLCMKEKKNKCREINSDFKEALNYFKLAADNGDPEGMAHYGRFIDYGYGIIKPDPKEAAKYYKMSYGKGDMTGCAHYGSSLIEGVGEPKNELRGLKLIERSCKHSNPYGMNFYGYFLHNGLSVLKKDINQAVFYYKKAADLGSAVGMSNYGLCLREGLGVVKDTKTAIKYFKLAVEEGNPRAAFHLGNTLSDPREGNKYLKYAADHGVKQAMHQFALNIYCRKGIKLNVDMMIKYLKDGINLGSQSCMRLYGKILMKGDVLAADKYEGVRYFNMAADLGDQISMRLYAESLEKGEGVMMDIDKAKKYRELASKCQQQHDIETDL